MSQHIDEKELACTDLVTGRYYAHISDHSYLFKYRTLLGNNVYVLGNIFMMARWRSWEIEVASGKTMLYELSNDDRVRWRDQLPVDEGRVCPTCGR